MIETSKPYNPDFDGKVYEVDYSVLNVRENAGQGYKVIATLEMYDKVTLTGNQESSIFSNHRWVEVILEDGETRGWVAIEGLKLD